MQCILAAIHWSSASKLRFRRKNKHKKQGLEFIYTSSFEWSDNVQIVNEINTNKTENPSKDALKKADFFKKNCKLRKMTRQTTTDQTDQTDQTDRLREGWCKNCQTCKIANLQFRSVSPWVTIISARDAGASENTVTQKFSLSLDTVVTPDTIKLFRQSRWNVVSDLYFSSVIAFVSVWYCLTQVPKPWWCEETVQMYSGWNSLLQNVEIKAP